MQGWGIFLTFATENLTTKTYKTMENKRNVVIVYQTDMWNTHASRSMRGIYPNLSTAMDAIVKHNKIKDGDTSEQSIRKELLQYGQTQCHNINYDIVEVTIGEWID